MTDEFKTLLSILTLEGKKIHGCPYSGTHDVISSRLFTYTNLFGKERFVIPCRQHLHSFLEVQAYRTWSLRYKEIKSEEDIE
jgi:hypothetical protein